MEKVKVSHLDISRTIGIPFDFSSDLSSGRRPTSESEEKSKGIPIALEIMWCEQLFTAEKVLHLFGASLRVTTRASAIIRAHGAYGPHVRTHSTEVGAARKLLRKLVEYLVRLCAQV